MATEQELEGAAMLGLRVEVLWVGTGDGDVVRLAALTTPARRTLL